MSRFAYRWTVHTTTVSLRFLTKLCFVSTPHDCKNPSILGTIPSLGYSTAEVTLYALGFRFRVFHNSIATSRSRGPSSLTTVFKKQLWSTSCALIPITNPARLDRKRIPPFFIGILIRSLPVALLYATYCKHQLAKHRAQVIRPRGSNCMAIHYRNMRNLPTRLAYRDGIVSCLNHYRELLGASSDIKTRRKDIRSQFDSFAQRL